MLKILALDLGTKTGVAHNYPGCPWATTWELATAKEITAWGKQRLTRRGDPRVSRLFALLSAGQRPDLVVFEDVEFSTYTKQTQLWASFRTAVWLAFEVAEPRAIVECVPVTTLKKFATGSGWADKAAMKRAMFTQFPDTDPLLDDNAIDALWILKWSLKNLSRMPLV
jgi:Holliday junction resolvasome RuvABC endonuclease subunit